MGPVDEDPSSTQSNSDASASISHAPAPRAGERTTNAAVPDVAVTVSVADIDSLPYTAVITTLSAAATVDVSTLNVAVRARAATVTVAGTLAPLSLLLPSCTVAPPAGAAAASVTVPCGWLCPWTVCGLIDSELVPVLGAGTGAGDGAGDEIGRASCRGAGAGEGGGVARGDVGVEPPPHWAEVSV